MTSAVHVFGWMSVTAGPAASMVFRLDELSRVEDDCPWHRGSTGVIRRADPTNGRVPREYRPIPAALITPIGWFLGRSVVSFGRSKQSVHPTVVNAGVMDHPVTGKQVVALAVRGNTVKLRHWRDSPPRHHRLPLRLVLGRWGGNHHLIGSDDDHEGFVPASVPQLLLDVFTAAGGTHEDWGEYDRVLAAEHRAAVFIHPTPHHRSGPILSRI